MYVPRHFQVDDSAARDLVQRLESGLLVTATPEGPVATLMPWLVDWEAGSLIGHMARPNPQWQTPWLGPASVMAYGPDGYVTPSWYASKAEHGRVVPTWDYVALQVQGQLIVHDDASWVDDAVRRLTHRFEQGRPAPWSVDDAPADYIAGQVRAIVGIEVRIERIEAAVKMSQNKPEDDVRGVVEGFEAEGRIELATWVRGPH